MRTLTHDEAREFYDEFGAKQDDQGWYEDVATAMLVSQADLSQAKKVLEFGCGTGRFALTLLSDHLGEDATYLGLDISETMIELSRGRLERFGSRVRLHQTSGHASLPTQDSTMDRVFSNYVLDLLSVDDIKRFFRESARVLHPGGLLCLTTLTHGASLPGKVVSTLWRIAHALRPQWVGGCRPVRVDDYVPADSFERTFSQVIAVKALTSEVWVGRRL